jgi:hypothetical protein
VYLILYVKVEVAGEAEVFAKPVMIPVAKQDPVKVIMVPVG